MDTYSDIAGLFAELPYKAEQYQEIVSHQEVDRASSRWRLVDEISHSPHPPEIEPPDKNESHFDFRD